MVDLTYGAVYGQLTDSLDRFRWDTRSGTFPHPAYPRKLNVYADRLAEPWTLVKSKMAAQHSWTWGGDLGEHLDSFRVITLDRNASYPYVCKEVLISLTDLMPGGPLDINHRGRKGGNAGLYLVDIPQWEHPRIGHPLGRLATQDGPQWITTPSLDLLDRLHRQNLMPFATCHASWIGEHKPAAFAAFAAYLAQTRDTLAGVREQLARFKELYGAVIQSMWGSKNTHVWRPDWVVSIQAESAKQLWLSAWKGIQDGAAVLRLGGTDEIDVLIAPDEEAPFNIGPKVGQFKIKAGMAVDWWKAGNHGATR